MTQQKETCEGCGKDVPGYDTVHFTTGDTTQQLCIACYNTYIADRAGLDFQHATFDPVTLQDVDGHNHTFNFTVRLLGPKVSIEAFELLHDNPCGYQFMVLGDTEADDVFELFGKLFERIRRALTWKHIEHNPDFGWRITDEQIVRGRISYDEHNAEDRLPCIIIDGKELSWRDFGRMLMSFEGWNLKLQIYDRSEEM
jgi:hypothetical protein